jgi:hypothetical protein
MKLSNNQKLKVTSLKLIVLLFTLFSFSLSPCLCQTGISVNNTGAAADYSAILDISSSFQGLLIPRMTITQRDAIASPALSLLIFNTTTNCFEAYVNGSWYKVSCAPACSNPAAPTAGSNIPCETQITWIWNTVTGAAGYKWSTVNNYAVAGENGGSVSYTQGGLTCNTDYSVYVWSYNSCGNSSGTLLNEKTYFCPNSQMQKTFGGALYDIANSIEKTKDGGYIIGGATKSFGAGGTDFLLVKTDAYGNITWNKTYGGSTEDFGYFAQQTSDGGYIIAGYTNSFGAGKFDYFLVKTDAIGNILWNKTYGGTDDELLSICKQTSDGGYIMGGYSTGGFGAGQYDAYVVKTDGNGNVIWSKTYGGYSGEILNTIQQTSDGGYILGGYTTTFGAGSFDFYFIKIDGSGNVLWSKTYGGTGDDRIYTLLQTADGGYILAGITNSFGAGADEFLVVKTDGSGNFSWSKTYGSAGYEAARSIQTTSDGGYIISGYSTGFGAGSFDAYLIKTDGSGNPSWSKTYGGGGNDYGFSVKQTGDGGYIIAGTATSFGAGQHDLYLLKTDENGSAGGCNTTAPSTIVNSPTPTVTSPNSIVTNPATLVNNPAATVTSPSLTVTKLCTKCN